MPPHPARLPLSKGRRPMPRGRCGQTAPPRKSNSSACRRRIATRLWHRARDFDRKTQQPGCHGGAVGHAALQVLHALIFDFLNYASGRLDPSYAAIARKANVCERTVAQRAHSGSRSLASSIGCAAAPRAWQDGRFVLEQETNAYAVLPPSQWRGYKEPPEPPPPAPGTWGDHPPLPSVLDQADRRTAGRRRHAGGDRHPRERSGRRARRGAGAARPGDASGKSCSDLPDCTPCQEPFPYLFIL